MHDDIINEYRRSDYVIIKGFFPADIMATYRDFMQRSLAQDVEAVLARWGLSVFAKDANEKVRELLKDADHIPVNDQQVLLGQFPLAVRLSDAIKPLAKHIGQSKILQAIFNSEHLYMHMPPMIRYVPPSYMPAAVPAHKDTSYNRHMSNFVTVWTPMVPITDTCGGLVMYEGSQVLPDVVTEDKRADSWLPPIDVSGYTRTQLTGLDVGDVVILSPQIVHESAANTSDTIRLSMDLRIFGQHDTSSKHCMDLEDLETLTAKAA
jgi:ectoine hydroxylase-related dioxygenase (phytanoyl-CoA dioxygenase family)